jgi:hypothetical protein
MQNNQSPEQLAATLKDQIATLERQVYLQLLVLIVVSGTLTSFFYRQASSLYKEIQLDNQAVEIVSEKRPLMEKFLKDLVEYGKKNPEFDQQILIKNGINGKPPTK